MKLSTKLILFITGSKLAIVALFILLLPFMVRQIADNYTNYTLEEQKEKVISIVNKNGIDYYLQGDDNYGSYTMLKEEYIALEPASPGTFIDTIRTTQRLVESDTLTYRVLSYTFKSRNRNYLLEIGKTTESIDQYNQPLQRLALSLLVVLIALTILIDLIFTRLLIRPLARIIGTKLVNRKFPFKDQPVKVKTSTSDFRYLDDSLIQLMDQINEAFTKEKEFTANASHELMTPISILQNKMENLLGDEILSEAAAIRIIEMMKTLDRLKKISGSLLLISRIENEQFVKKEQVNLSQLLEEVIGEVSHRLEEKNIKIHSRVSENVQLKDVSQNLIFQLFYNLIHNAIKFNKQDGEIFIEESKTLKGQYQVTVRDTGAGIPPGQIPFIFDRFRKANLPENVGYGLGLAIVKSIAVYHHIKIRVDSKVGEGTGFVLLFPETVVKPH